jgi:hypothetical protein
MPTPRANAPQQDASKSLRESCSQNEDVPKSSLTFLKKQQHWCCLWRIRKLRCDWHLEQPAAMVPPNVVIKDGMGGWRFARSFFWGAATERLVNAVPVVINSELFQLSPQVDRVPD